MLEYLRDDNERVCEVHMSDRRILGVVGEIVNCQNHLVYHIDQTIAWGHMIVVRFHLWLLTPR
jgi:hypothetical protein